MEKQIPQSDPQSRASASAPQVETQPQLADVTRADRAREHYADVVNKLLLDAIKNDTESALSNVLTLNLAWLIVEFGPGATSHVLERLGSHISYFVERNRAEKEAAQAREAGQQAH